MRLKYKVSFTLIVSGLITGFGGYFSGLLFGVIVGLVLFAVGLSTFSFSDKEDKSIISILADGIFFSL